MNQVTVTAGVLAVLSWAWTFTGHAGTSETNTMERLKALKSEVLDASAKSQSAGLRAADANIPSMLKLIRSVPNSPMAFETLRWVMLRAEIGSKPYEPEVVELLRDYHAKNPQMGWICHGIGYYASHLDDWRKQTTMDLLRVVSESNPDRSARGQATLALARLIKSKAAYLQCFQNSIPAMRNTRTAAHRAEYFERWSNQDEKVVSAEAQRLFDAVIQQYGDCREFPRKPNPTLAETAKRDLFELCHLALGQKAPDLEGVDLDGRRLRLADFGGKIVVLCFWATWCPSCMSMVPQERALVARMAGWPFAFVGVNGDEDRTKAKAAAQKLGMSWPSFWDRGPVGPISTDWNVQGWPMVYILDAKGNIRFKAMDDGANMDEAVEELIKENPDKK
jgi:peroxiredoxin